MEILRVRTGGYKKQKQFKLMLMMGLKCVIIL